MIQTYGSRYPDGGKTYGGFANYWRGPSSWVFAIPTSMPAAEAAPMLCGGITVYAPLKRFGCGPGKSVGVAGVGGLGHFAILFAKALGADNVVALSRSSSKREDALKLGATDYIATGEDKEWFTKHGSSLDIIINTMSTPEVSQILPLQLISFILIYPTTNGMKSYSHQPSQIPLDGFFSLLRVNGAFVQLGVPALPPPNMFLMAFKGLTISGSLIGPPEQIREMLDFAASHEIHPMVEEAPMKDANRVIQDLDAGKARFRYVLVN